MSHVDSLYPSYDILRKATSVIFSNTISQYKELGSLGEMADFESGAEHTQGRPQA